MTAPARKLALAKRMRTEPSAIEALLWRLLRDRRLEGLKFRRQVPIGRYVVDFVCFRHRLIVEADGPFHDPEADALRDSWLRGQGFRVLRFDNSLISARRELVLQTIEDAAVGPRERALRWPER
jgi:very-short-patch-repair endonuclease